jgi:hypothetical protein
LYYSSPRIQQKWFGNFLNFLRFYTDFTSFCKRSNTITEHPFTEAPRSLRCLQKYPRFAIRPSGRFGTSQCSPRAPAGGGPAKFRRTAGRDRPGAGGDRPSSPWRSIPGLGWGREKAGEGGGAPAASGGGLRDWDTGGGGSMKGSKDS